MRPPEQLIIRPPTEAGSLLIRVTRGCNWNRCKFCGIYGHFGQPDFETRPVQDVKQDILAARELWGPDWDNAFLGDADPMFVEPDDFAEILTFLRETFPALSRVTCYARASTCAKRREHLARFHQAGLDRVHVGLETGSDALLRFHRKGASAKLFIESGLAVRQAGIELSHYVLLGLGGAQQCDEHVRETLRVLNAVQPEFVRFRRLWIFGSEGGPHCPLWEDVQAGKFVPQTPEGTVLELRSIITGIQFPTQVEAIHGNVYVQLAGRIPDQRDSMLRRIGRFLERPEPERARAYARQSVI